MEDKYFLNRFIEAQSSIYENAFNEIKNGKKSSHWMWYIFPQYKGLGFSSISKKYAINSIDEGKSFLEHPILFKRLKEITTAFLAINDKSALDILGSPDDLKMKSSMTLFNAIQNETNVFDAVLEKYYEGVQCEKTLYFLKL